VSGRTSGDIFAKVIDFGIVKLERGSTLAAPEHAPPGARRATLGDVVLGTVPYYCGHEGREGPYSFVGGPKVDDQVVEELGI